MDIGERIRQARKKLEISQETLAGELGLSVQAVSKWECGQSCPDIALLPRIADFLGVSLDMLLRGGETGRNEILPSLPDDGILRIVQCVGRKVISREEWENLDSDRKIPLCTDGQTEMSVEVWGSAEISGDITGTLQAGTSIACQDVGGNVSAGNNVACQDVGGNVNAGVKVACQNVNGNVSAGVTVSSPYH